MDVRCDVRYNKFEKKKERMRTKEPRRGMLDKTSNNALSLPHLPTQLPRRLSHHHTKLGRMKSASLSTWRVGRRLQDGVVGAVKAQWQ